MRKSESINIDTISVRFIKKLKILYHNYNILLPIFIKNRKVNVLMKWVKNSRVWILIKYARWFLRTLICLTSIEGEIIYLLINSVLVSSVVHAKIFYKDGFFIDQDSKLWWVWNGSKSKVSIKYQIFSLLYMERDAMQYDKYLKLDSIFISFISSDWRKKGSSLIKIPVSEESEKDLKSEEGIIYNTKYPTYNILNKEKIPKARL